jgi:hypothetical protein
MEGTLFPFKQTVGMRSRALVELRSNRPQSALAFAECGLAAAEQGSYLLTVSVLNLTRAEALHALGRTDDKRTAIREARDRVCRSPPRWKMPSSARLI